MSANTSIQWTEKTWNPVRGCSIVSPGCVNCYAMKQAHRFSGPGGAYKGLTKQTKAGPQWTGVVRTIDEALREPLSWRKPTIVFVNSMSDLFHEDVPDEFIDRVFSVMGLAGQHTFQVLTKRPDRMRQYITSRPPSPTVPGEVNIATESGLGVYHVRWPLPNVWLGVSVENQETADERIPLLLQTPASVRFISAEPLLGPIDLASIRCPDQGDEDMYFMDALSGGFYERETVHDYKHSVDGPTDYGQLDWVIVGGESGPGARLFDIAWGRSIVKQCKRAKVPVFVKQLGSVPWVKTTHHYGPGVDAYPYNVRYDLKDRKGSDMSEWPEDLRVREFPRVEATS